MPQLAPVVLKDAADADQTFNPKGIVSGVATLVRSNGVPVSDHKLTLSHSRTQTGREKIAIKLMIPVVQDMVVNGVSKPTAVRASFADITFTFDGTSNATERDNLLSHVKSLLGTTFCESVVIQLEDIY